MKYLDSNGGLEGRFVHYIAGVKTSHLSRRLASNLNVSSIQAKDITELWVSLQRKASLHLRISSHHLKAQQQGP